MPRKRRESGLDFIARSPWPVGFLLGITAFFAVRYGIPWYFAQSGGGLGKALGEGLAEGPAKIFSWLVLLLCWMAAGVSFVRGRQRATLFDAQARSPQLSSLDWRQFERLVAEWFHRQGYQVDETGGSGADGGIDLVLRKDGRTEIVQCKHWRRRQVPVTTVREMWGLMQHHNAGAVWIVCLGAFTPDAAAFAIGKPIRLVTGTELGTLIQAMPVQPAGPPASTALPEITKLPVCPKCGSTLVERQNRRTNERFLGCASYPSCRGTLAIPS